MSADTDAEFKRMVAYCWIEKDDPTRYSGWDPARCQALMPAFYEAWSKCLVYRELATLAARAADDGREES